MPITTVLRTGTLSSGVLTLIAAVAGFGISPAVAGDGRVPIVNSEIAAQYVHSLDRAGSPEEIERYARWPREDKCSWGLQDATYRIATSIEAQERWHRNPQDLAGMLYASVLDRAPDPGGLVTYTAAISDRGLNWATTAMLASDEYHNRIARICGARDVTEASMWSADQAFTFADDVLVRRAINLGATCGVMKKLQGSMGLKKDYKNARALLLSIDGEITNRIYSRFSDPCKAAAAYLKAAVHIALIAGDRNNPVFIQYEYKTGRWSRNTSFTVRVGGDPTSWSGYSGKVV